MCVDAAARTFLSRQVAHTFLIWQVVSAMRMLVAYILRRPGPEGQASSDEDVLSKEDAVTIEGDKMTQLCLYQLVLGYKLREAEATGEAQLRVGL